MEGLTSKKDEGVARILVSEEEIKAIVKRLASEVSRDYDGKNLIIICILKGAFVFLSDLVRALDIDCEVDFMAVSSYGSGIKTSGRIKIEKDLSLDIRGYHVLIAEDILDSGRSLSKITEMLKGRNPESVEICTLFSKPSRREVDIEAKYVGMEVSDEFIVGYGLDYAEKYRSLPYIGVLKPEVYES